jgi:prepilin-type processing-associated H-X9-DG protein
MSLTPLQIANGFPMEKELFFAEQPSNPEMRESTSVWIFEENGAFAFPRGGIEAEAACWNDRMHQSNFAFADGRVMNGAGRGPGHSPFDAEGKPTILGAGPISFKCVAPFDQWKMIFEGPCVYGTVDEQIANKLSRDKTKPVRLEVDMKMATPAWIQDNSPERVAKMTKKELQDAEYMGIGWRFEHLFRCEGKLAVDGEVRAFKGQGLRIKRQSVRPLAGFRGHCWQSALFPDGRAFGYITYPPREDGSTLNEAYIYQDGKMYPARATKIPWLRRIVGAGDDCSLALESELGTTRIAGVSALSTFRVRNPDLPGLDLQQGGVRYTWDGQTAFGMIERSSLESLTTID